MDRPFYRVYFWHTMSTEEAPFPNQYLQHYLFLYLPPLIIQALYFKGINLSVAIFRYHCGELGKQVLELLPFCYSQGARPWPINKRYILYREIADNQIFIVVSKKPHQHSCFSTE